MNVSDIRQLLVDELEYENFVTDKTGVKTIEIMGQSFIADEPAIIGTPNEDYIKREIEWYESQSLMVDDIPGDTPAIWQQISSKYGEINSNYGWCIFSYANHYQFASCVDALAEDEDTRRAIMIYTRPSMQNEYNRDGMSDFMCTNTVQYLIRNGKINAIVNMRSNDVVFGYKNDYAWQKYVLDKVVSYLNKQMGEGYEAGDIIWCAGSLHVYERHFDLIRELTQ